MRSTRWHRAGIMAGLLLLLVLPATPLSAQAWPPEPKNLQHFPQDIDVRQLLGTMRTFAFGLGVRCQHCHVGEEGQAIATFDFASDEKETKRKARAMLKMVDAINADLRDNLGVEPAELVRVECVTCHRGVTRPRQLYDILAETATAEGTEAAKTRYRELRDEYFGSHTYDFSEGTLVRAAEAMAGGGDLASAVALLRFNLEWYPESARTLGTLAQAEQRQGDLDGAIEAMERLRQLMPDDPRIQEQIDKLKMEKEGSAVEPDQEP